ncbi:MAG: hypothetical protein A2351_01410 [Omnitrophica bacterium RIFOXYB12_FULL_50_7]|nr:MAG: hypothetical protein A2351_01410 [Omnitrophica bacterium RIFOXYB12_FULL_50_7]
MKNIIIAVIVAVAIVASAFVVKVGVENSRRMSPPEAYSLFGFEGVVYRLNNVNGRVDVLVPSNEAALLFPVGQIQLPGANDKLTDEQKKSFSQNIQTLSRYIQGERARSLGLKVEEAPAPEVK